MRPTRENASRITGSGRSPPRRDSRGTPARSFHGRHKTALALVVKRLGEDETLIALRRDLRAALAIAADALGTEIGQNARGLPGMLALIHQEFASGSSVPLTTSLTCAAPRGERALALGANGRGHSAASKKAPSSVEPVLAFVGDCSDTPSPSGNGATEQHWPARASGLGNTST